ncbi:MAG TPA: hypothetical protein VN729_05965, partial [Ktedonobacteraceae bacterium]|nr:hypothetical protein [Ktedonobacteraceae bacterium]
MYQPSTPPSITPHSGRTALIYGLSAGLGLGIIESAIIVYLTRNMYHGPYSLLSIPFSLLLWIIVLLVIGALAAKRTGKINTGVLAGLWSGMAGGIIAAVTLFVATTSFVNYGYYGYASMMALSLTYIIVLILGALGLGTGLGALGGLIGQSFSTIATPILRRQQQQSD